MKKTRKFATMLVAILGFVLFLAFILIIRLNFDSFSEDELYYGLFSANDFLLSLLVGLVIGFTYGRLAKLKNRK